MNKACRLLGDRVEELADEAEKVRVGLSGLLDGPSALSPDRTVESSFGEAAAWIGEALSDMSERLRRLNEVIAEMNERAGELSAAGRPVAH